MKNNFEGAAMTAEMPTAQLSENDILIEQAYEALAGEAVSAPENGVVNNKKPSKWEKWKANFKRRGWILLFILPALIYVIIFCSHIRPSRA